MFDVDIVTSKGDTDCGPACLKMLLGYYGINVLLDDLITECGVQISGCTGADLMRVGRAHGLEMDAFRMDADELIRQDRPAIVWWRYTHWVVMCGMDEHGNVVIANPGRGRFGIDKDSFSKIYSGIAIFRGNPDELTNDFFGENEPEPEYFDN